MLPNYFGSTWLPQPEFLSQGPFLQRAGDMFSKLFLLVNNKRLIKSPFFLNTLSWYGVTKVNQHLSLPTPHSKYKKESRDDIWHHNNFESSQLSDQFSIWGIYTIIYGIHSILHLCDPKEESDQQSKYSPITNLFKQDADQYLRLQNG